MDLDRKQEFTFNHDRYLDQWNVAMHTGDTTTRESLTKSLLLYI